MFETLCRAGEAAVLSLPLTACASTLDKSNAPSIDHQPAVVTISLSKDFYRGFQIQRRLDDGIFSLNSINAIHAYSSNGHLELTLQEGFTAATAGKVTFGSTTIKNPDIKAKMSSIVRLETNSFSEIIWMQVQSGELTVHNTDRTFIVRDGGLLELRGEIRYNSWEDFDAAPTGIKHITPKLEVPGNTTGADQPTQLSAEQFPISFRDER